MFKAPQYPFGVGVLASAVPTLIPRVAAIVAARISTLFISVSSCWYEDGSSTTRVSERPRSVVAA
jgi:hypothetical protein